MQNSGWKQGAPAPPVSGSRRCTMRVVKDSDGGMVLVYESEPAITAGPRTLVFESGHGRMRLDRYPADWRVLKDRDLLALLGS